MKFGDDDFTKVKRLHVKARTIDITNLQIEGYQYDNTDESADEIVNRLGSIVFETGVDDWDNKVYNIEFYVDVLTGDFFDINDKKILLDVKFLNKIGNEFSVAFVDAVGGFEWIEDIYVPNSFAIDEEGYGYNLEFTVEKSKIQHWNWDESLYFELLDSKLDY